MLEEGSWKEVRKPLDPKGLYDLRFREEEVAPIYVGEGDELRQIGTLFEKHRQIVACRGRLNALLHLHGYHGQFTGEQIGRFMRAQGLMFEVLDRLKTLIGIAEIFSPDKERVKDMMLRVQAGINAPQMIRAANQKLVPEGLSEPTEFAYSGFKLHFPDYGFYIARVEEDAQGRYGIRAEIKDGTTNGPVSI